MKIQRRTRFFFCSLLIGAGFLPVFATQAAGASTPLRIEVLSSEASRVTGGDALVGVTAANRNARDNMIVRLNGKIVTGRLRANGNSLRRIGVISGLRNGRNWITAWAPGQNSGSRHSVYNSSLQGPILSGPHQQPFYCTTEKWGLGPAQDANCFAPTRVSWYYRANNNTFKPLASPTDRPADMVQTTTRTGETVGYVVRLEQGVINRAVYSFASLAAGGQLGNGWNGRFYYLYGGGCSAGHQQGGNSPDALDNDGLSRGFVVLTSSLNVLNNSCNDVLSAETTSMVKEHAIEEMGRPDVWTAGEGGSGGSVQIQMISQNYPGLLDGITPGASFPDNSSPDYADCRLLQNYFDNTTTGQNLSEAQRASITGMESTVNGGCNPLGAGADVVNASEGCDENVVPVSVIFDPVTNPEGVRCTIWDNMINIYGPDPQTGYARRTYDNTGIQYGLQSYLDGDINMKRFLDLNEFIGGYDNNGILQPARSVANQDALNIAYKTGRFNTGAGNWASVPVIDRRTYQDVSANGNVHQFVNTYRLRARLDLYNGNHDNHVMFRAQGTANVNAMNTTAIDLLSDWLDAIAADDSSKSLPQKVVDNKPADAVDACWINGSRVNGVAEIGNDNPCENTYPPHSLPANRAGKPLNSIAGKCTLAPVDPADYGSPTPDQIARLNAIFPNGVCDWSQPGPGQGRLTSNNLNRSFGPGQNLTTANRRLGLVLDRYRVNQSRRGATVRMTASLSPCPAVTWQTVRFERRVKQGRNWVWRQVASRMATGNRCQANFRVERIRRQTRLRARVVSIDGFRWAASPVRTVRINPVRRDRR